MNNLLSVNLSLRRSFKKEKKSFNLQKTDGFKNTINKYLKNDKSISSEKYKDVEESKNIKEQDFNFHKNENAIEKNTIKKVDQEDENQELNSLKSNEKFSNNDELIKELEYILSFLQSVNVNSEDINNLNKVEEMKTSLIKVYNDISNEKLNNKDIEELFVKLEEADFLPKDVKDKVVYIIKNIKEKISVDTVLNLNKKELDVNLDNLESNKKDIKKINSHNIKSENTEDKSSIVRQASKIDKVDKNFNLNNSLNSGFIKEDEDLHKLEKKFLGIHESNNEDEMSLNLQDFNTLKASQNLKNISSSLNLRQVNGINHNDILEQIIKKSKLIIDKDNSSMEIKLEPEHLGKLTLKVVFERGILSAKFIAENDDVKTIIENNMDELKENLLEQGLNIQSLSVSVDSQGDLNKHRNILEAMAYNKRISKNLAINDVVEEEKENPYLYNDEKFNELA
ncbi:flagellar hook-length control protein FliK [Tepidibacter thalassicus]|uniref:Hook-length control protein FliK n=1 Tax=Tepidibacter thalassicus DSM 15285 TaxID=1123350 RepID=A0A1M5NSY2_9FIRM|nr:flagellar hook-length control protein FliK [Tepidibacter thalassicus]SHG92642.1 hook-length control protein FliK [Tepidibacter thalassicus DSM 15285]